MAKASFASKDFYSPGIFTEGNFHVTAARTLVFQYPPSRETGEQVAPFLGAELTIQTLDSAGQPTDDELLTKILRIDGNLDKMRPGLAKSRDDDSPADQGDDLGAEGNCVFSEEGTKINGNSIWGRFIKSVEDKGFKPGVLSAGFMPDLVGLVAHGITQRSEKRTIRGREVETMYFIVDKIMQRPESGAKKGPTVVKKAQAVNGAPAAPATPAATQVAAPAADDAAERIAGQILAEVAAELGGEKRDERKLYAMLYSRLVRDKAIDKKLHGPVSELFKSVDWLTAQSANIPYTFENGVFSFE